ncbi:phage major capsid protein [Exiguobacterium mexicanum]
MGVHAAVTLTNQLINDSGTNIEDYVKNLLARRVVKVVERSMLVGQTSEELNGIAHDENLKSISMDGVVSVDTFFDLYTSIHPEYLDEAAFIMNKEFFDQVAKLKDTNGHFYMQSGVVNGKIIRTLFGAPVHVTDSLPAETPVIFGNYQEGVSMMIKQQSGLQEIVDSKQALRGSKLFVFDMYIDSIVTNPQALVKLKQA